MSSEGATPIDSGLGRGRPADMPTRGTTSGAGQARGLDDAEAARFAEHRPIPAANAWPDDAVLVTYAELRRLVALHLEVCRQSMPREKPWEWLTLRAGAVRDGEAPLLLSEVLD